MNKAQPPSLRRALPVGRPGRPQLPVVQGQDWGEPQKRERKRRDPRVGWGEKHQVSARGRDGNLVGVDWRILKGLGREANREEGRDM